MNMRLCTFALFGLLVCIACSGLEPSAALCGEKDAKDATNSIVALFDGIPADLRSKVKNNSVRRDRVNGWLRDHVNGKGKTIELQLPVRVTAILSKEETYTIVVSLVNKGGGFGGFAGDGPKVAVLGDEWPIFLTFAAKDPPDSPNSTQLELAGVSVADAEKLVELDRAKIKGNVQLVGVTENSVRLILEDMQVDGKKMTARKLQGGKFKAPK
jgi:hypothetical protein